MSGYSQWNPATTYPPDDIVSYASALWKSLQITTNNIPPSSPTFWTQVGGGGAVSSIVAGTGISVSGTSTVTVSNTGVLSVASAGTGITIAGTAQNPTVQNDGVLTVSAGYGLSISGTAQNPTITNTGIVNVVAGTGIGVVIAPPETATVSNNGVLALTAGSGVSITGTPANYTISATGSGGTLTGIGAGTNITVDNTNPAVPVVASDIITPSTVIGGSGLVYNLTTPYTTFANPYNTLYVCKANPEGTGTDFAAAFIYSGTPNSLNGYTTTYYNANTVDNIWINIQSSPGVTYHNVQLNPSQSVAITPFSSFGGSFQALRNKWSQA